jgi:16S rRNA (adenine1518-N6/adenine1519-N6)-dimethyltransferase
VKVWITSTYTTHNFEAEYSSKIFLRMDLTKFFGENFAVAGNYPYNISSQIVFRILDYKEYIPEMVGMFQKEVAIRFASGPGNKDYGIISVFSASMV